MSRELEELIDKQEKIVEALNRGNRIEIVPVKNGIKVLEIERRSIK